MIPSSSRTTSRRRSRSERFPGLLAGACAALIAACAPVPVPGPPPEAPPLPQRSVENAARFEVAARGTEVYARVFRGGRLARLGHNHVILFGEVRGNIYLATPVEDSLFDLLVTPGRAVVDPAELRSAQGESFQTELSEDARSRTRRNMLGPEVLDAATHPHVTASSTAIRGSLPRPRVTLELLIRGSRRRLTIPVSIDQKGNRLTASGRLEILQSDFGIEPFSALGGALKVQDRVEIVFRIAARRNT